MPDVDVGFFANYQSWIPGAYTTDATGKFKTEANFAPGERYLAYVSSGGFTLASSAFEVPQSPPFTVKLIVEAVATVGRVVANGL